LDRNPGIVSAGVNPLIDYVTDGASDGRDPHPLFSSTYYLTQNPDVQNAGINPLVHYLANGGLEGRNPIPAFDSSYYLEEYPDVAAACMNPLLHYWIAGAAEGRNPNKFFDTNFYMESHPDVAASGMNPLAHFVQHGREAGYQPHRESLNAFEAPAKLQVRGPILPSLGGPQTTAGRIAFTYPPNLAPVHDTQVNAAPSPPVRAIAFYLPQFHPIPENDQWWGKGFTEWTNVTRARPIFPGHHQPQLPADLGFYDLRLPEVLEQQAALAAQYGIAGFCFYYYWFNGKKLLERPVEQMLVSGKPDFPFCLCWANENWTRTWDGGEKEILIEQEYSADADERFIRELIPAMRDKRYIRIDGAPLLLVYRVTSLPDPAATAKRWREVCEREGIGRLHLSAVQIVGMLDPRPYGFDSAVEFPPLVKHRLIPPELMPGIDPEFAGYLEDYAALAEDRIAAEIPPYVRFRGAMPAWDNTARRGNRAHICVRHSPDLYGQWLHFLALQTLQTSPPEQRLLFVNAWNEWAEGAHLEPDRKNGHAYLAATRNALARASAEYYSARGFRVETSLMEKLLDAPPATRDGC
jgi:hypothetical protein